MTEIIVRPARPEDKAKIVAFCQTTFSWGDYIEHIWDEWIEDPGGRIYVGLLDDEPVGMVHVALLENHVGWMEGMRVHPGFRRHGIGTAIDLEGREYARAHGCRVARLATSMKNIPAQRSLGPQGYHHLASYNEWIAPALDDYAPVVRIAYPRDFDEVLAIWRTSRLHDKGSGLLPDPRWRWTEFTPSRCEMQIESGQVRLLASGMAILVAHEDESEIHLHALVGDGQLAQEIGLEARREAAFRGYVTVEALLEQDPVLDQAIGESGFRREGGMLIYEQTL